MHDGGMSDDTIIANGTGCTGVGMDHRIILDVAAFAYADGIGIATKDGTKPQGGIFFYDDISDGDGIGRHEGGGVYLRGLLQFS